MNTSCLSWFVLLALGGSLGLASAQPAPLLDENELARASQWQVATPQSVQRHIHEWARASEKAPPESFEFAVADTDSPFEPPLPRLNQTIAHWFPETRPLADRLARSLPRPQSINDLFPDKFWEQEKYPASIRNQWQLSVGIWLAQNQMYDESQRMLALLTPGEVCDPASLLYYRGMTEHQLLNTEACLKSIELLLENEQTIPVRFSVVGKLMRDDLDSLEENSLDEIARLMGEVHRRQSLYRSGQRVRNQEQEVVDKLDQMIEEIEQQMQQQQQQLAKTNRPSSQPIEKSENAGGLGDGGVTDRNAGEGGAWGNLPPKQRAAALTELVKDLPPHYREVIEEYFRQLAKDPRKPH